MPWFLVAAPGLVAMVAVDRTAASDRRTELTARQPSPCSGRSIDLGQLLIRRECEVSDVPPPRDLRAVVAPTIVLSPNHVAGGETVTVRMSFRNVSDEPVDLYFTAHAGPMTGVEVTEAGTGDRVFPPPDMPPSPFRPGPPYPVRGTVLPGGEISREMQWQASRHAWMTEAPPTPVSLPAMRTTGPLPPGTYLVRMQVMFHFAGYGLEQPVGRLEVR